MDAGSPGVERRAAALRERREQIVTDWEDRVRANPSGPRLDGPSLRDHVVEILDRVAAILAPQQGMDGDPRDHGRTRASQGVDVAAVITELGILRRGVVEMWAAEGPLELEALRALDRVIDEAAKEAARRIADTHDMFFRGVDAISRVSLEARDVDELLARLLGEIVRTSAAVDAAAVLLRDGDRLAVRAAVGTVVDVARAEPVRVGEGFAGRVAAEARPILLEDAGADGEGAGALLRGDIRAVYGVPLVHQGGVIGVAVMGSLHATGLRPEDRRLFESMASRASLAVARQLALDRERRHREELALLSRLSRNLAERMDLAERLQRAADTLVPELADCCAIFLVEDGEPRCVALEASDAALAHAASEVADAPADPRDARGVGRVLRDGVSELLPDVEAEAEAGAGAAWPDEARARLRRLGFRSFLAVPLAVPTGVIGALALGTGASDRRFDAASLDLAADIARRIAVAVENARLFENARREALLREHVLAVVSHDLRNPLSTVVMGAARIEAKDTGRDDVLRVTGAMRRAARRMERLIADLVDVAVIQSGRLSVSPQPWRPAELVREAVEAVRAIAQERGLLVEATAGPELPPVRADRDRVLQVLVNLLSNAVDVTPSGGRVHVHAEASGRGVRFSVSDTGPGLSPDEAAHVFEPYRRGNAPGYKGTGLGLAIASGIVAAHGGSIGVDAVPGKGARFWFVLPLAADPAAPGW